MRPAIRLQGLTKLYGATLGVEGLNLEVATGEVFGFLGPNGAGKTTTIRLLMDLLRPTAGTLSVLGLDPRRDGVELRRRVGYLPGELALYEDLTAEELLRYFGALRGGASPFVRSLAERLDLDLTRRIGSLSQGNKRKVGLVAAMMHDPELLILDEPTAGLDPLVQAEFHRLIEELRARGRTVFLSSHNLPEVERVCDRVGVIRKGRLAAIEDVGELHARALREIEIHFAGPVPAERFSRLPGVREAVAEGDLLRLRVEGSLDLVIKEAAAHTVVNVSTREPGLEEIFLAFYGKADRDAA